MTLFAPGIRRLALQAPSRLFVCCQCLRQAPRSTPSRILNVVRSRSYADARPSVPAGGVADQIKAQGASQAQKQSKKAFPEVSSKSVAYWLVGSAVSVFGIVVFGGLTRLTESGYA